MYKSLVGLVVGVTLTLVAGWVLLPSIMIKETLSPYSTEETIRRITANAREKGWVVSSVKGLHQSISKNGGGQIAPLMLVNLCQADHAFTILQHDEYKKVSVFMPCTLSVYEKSDGQTYIATMNAGLLGKMFGGTVASVMGEAAHDQQRFIEFAR